MAFRDDTDAAIARADALARELADKDDSVSRLETELEEVRHKMAEVERELARSRDPAETSADDAHARLVSALEATSRELERSHSARARLEAELAALRGEPEVLDQGTPTDDAAAEARQEANLMRFTWQFLFLVIFLIVFAVTAFTCGRSAP